MFDPTKKRVKTRIRMVLLRIVIKNLDNNLRRPPFTQDNDNVLFSNLMIKNISPFLRASKSYEMCLRNKLS